MLGSSAHVQQVPVHAGDPEPGDPTIDKAPNSQHMSHQTLLLKLSNCRSFHVMSWNKPLQRPMKNIEIKFQLVQSHLRSGMWKDEPALQLKSQLSRNVSIASRGRSKLALNHIKTHESHEHEDEQLNWCSSEKKCFFWHLIPLSSHLWKSPHRRPAASAWYQGRSSSPKAKGQRDLKRWISISSRVFQTSYMKLYIWRYMKLYKCSRWLVKRCLYFGLEIILEVAPANVFTTFNNENFQPLSAPQEWHQADDRNLQEPWMHIGTRWSNLKVDHWPTLVLHRPPKEDKLFRSSASNMKPCTQKTWCERILFNLFIPPIGWVFWQKGSLWQMWTMQQLHFLSRCPER